MRAMLWTIVAAVCLLVLYELGIFLASAVPGRPCWGTVPRRWGPSPCG